MMLLNGLGVANHLLAALTTPILAVVLLGAARRKLLSWGAVVVAAVCWLAGSLPYSGLVVGTLLRTGDGLGTIRSALFGTVYADNVLNGTVTLWFLGVDVAFVLLNFPTFLLPAAVFGLAGRSRVPSVARRALLAALMVHAVFALRYDVPDRFFFFLPMYFLLTLWGAVGFARLGMVVASSPAGLGRVGVGFAGADAGSVCVRSRLGTFLAGASFGGAAQAVSG